MGDEISDMSILELLDHYEKWIADLRTQTMAVDLRDQQQLIGTIKDIKQDLFETMHILHGVLKQLAHSINN